MQCHLVKIPFQLFRKFAKSGSTFVATFQIYGMEKLIAVALLYSTLSVSAQNETATDSIDTSAFDKYLDESNDFTHLMNGTGYYNRINASRLGFGGNREMFSWSGLLNADFTPVKHGMVQLNARYHSATLVPQGKTQESPHHLCGIKLELRRRRQETAS